jgi:hypothetical protein
LQLMRIRDGNSASISSSLLSLWLDCLLGQQICVEAEIRRYLARASSSLDILPSITHPLKLDSTHVGALASLVSCNQLKGAKRP